MPKSCAGPTWMCCVPERRAARWRWRLKPTVAGVLLFGKPVALRRSFPMTRVDCPRARTAAMGATPSAV